MLALIVAVSFALAGARPASAHAELVTSNPASGEVLDVAPEEVVLTFEAEVTSDSAFTVEDERGVQVGGGELDLDVVERNVLRGSVEIEEPGDYAVRWSVTDAGDGDTSTGELRFSVRSDEPLASTRPDTSLGPVGSRVIATTAAGAALLGAAVASAAALWIGRRRRAEA